MRSVSPETRTKQPVVQVESVDVHDSLFHHYLSERQGPDFRPALHRIAEAQRSVYNPSRGSLGIVPNILLWCNRALWKAGIVDEECEITVPLIRPLTGNNLLFSMLKSCKSCKSCPKKLETPRGTLGTAKPL